MSIGTTLSPVQHRIARQGVSPSHKHDCQHCVFLGTVDEEHGSHTLVDLYVCPAAAAGTTYVARFSDEPGDNDTKPASELRRVEAPDFIRNRYYRRFGLALNLVVARDILQETYVPHMWTER